MFAIQKPINTCEEKGCYTLLSSKEILKLLTQFSEQTHPFTLIIFIVQK